MRERILEPATLRQTVLGLALSLLVVAVVAQTTVSHTHSWSSETPAVAAAAADPLPPSTAHAAASCPACSFGFARVGVTVWAAANALPIALDALRLSPEAAPRPSPRRLRAASPPRAPPFGSLSLA